MYHDKKNQNKECDNIIGENTPLYANRRQIDCIYTYNTHGSQ